MMVAASCVAVVLFAVVLAGLTIGGLAFASALPIAWAVSCAAFLLVCLVGYGASISGEWRER